MDKTSTSHNVNRTLPQYSSFRQDSNFRWQEDILKVLNSAAKSTAVEDLPKGYVPYSKLDLPNLTWPEPEEVVDQVTNINQSENETTNKDDSGETSGTSSTPNSSRKIKLKSLRKIFRKPGRKTKTRAHKYEEPPEDGENDQN